MVGWRYFGKRMTLAAGDTLPAFFDHVLRVVARRSKEEMLRVDAGWLVAGVTNQHAVRRPLELRI
jgi:hypothetical protein